MNVWALQNQFDNCYTVAPVHLKIVLSVLSDMVEVLQCFDDYNSEFLTLPEMRKVRILLNIWLTKDIEEIDNIYTKDETIYGILAFFIIKVVAVHFDGIIEKFNETLEHITENGNSEQLMKAGLITQKTYGTLKAFNSYHLSQRQDFQLVKYNNATHIWIGWNTTSSLAST